MKRVQNKVILVTGGAMGMGRTHSELLAEEGAWVFVADMNADVGCATVDEIRKSGGKAAASRNEIERSAAASRPASANTWSAKSSKQVQTQLEPGRAPSQPFASSLRRSAASSAGFERAT